LGVDRLVGDAAIDLKHKAGAADAGSDAVVAALTGRVSTLVPGAAALSAAELRTGDTAVSALVELAHLVRAKVLAVGVGLTHVGTVRVALALDAGAAGLAVGVDLAFGLGWACNAGCATAAGERTVVAGAVEFRTVVVRVALTPKRAHAFFTSHAVQAVVIGVTRAGLRPGEGNAGEAQDER
jgi:hypothetical protein